MKAPDERDAATEQARHRAASLDGTETSAPHESHGTAAAAVLLESRQCRSPHKSPRPHPVRCVTEPVRLSGAVNQVPRAFIRCTGDIDPDEPSTDLLGPFAARAKAEGWLYREVPTKHDPHWFDPEGTARVIH